MEAIVERVASIDVHKKVLMTCVLKGAAEERARKTLKKFGAYPRDLAQMRDWFRSEGVTHVVMESTGPYWIPVYGVLEEAGCFTLIVGNAQHIKNVPGRKTDVKDAEWLARLGRAGMIRPSFVPPREFRELRDLTRYRHSLVNARSTERNRLQKLLETARVKLDCVASDVFGASGTAMLRMMAAGEADSSVLAEQARGALRKKKAELVLALDAELSPHHRFLLNLQLEGLDALEARIARVDAEIERRLEPHAEAVKRLCQVPGIGLHVAAAIIAEIGVDMTAFGSIERLAAWSGTCPGNNVSAGKRLPGQGARTRKGNVHLKTTLVEAAQAAVRCHGTYYRDKFYRLRARRGHQRAVMAIAHKLLAVVFVLLRDGVEYRDLGPDYLDRRNEARVVANMVLRLNQLGYDVRKRNDADDPAAAA